MGIIDKYSYLVDEFILTGKRLYELGYQRSDGGNLSIRIPGNNLMIIKPTRCSFSELNKDNVVIAKFDGTLVEGRKNPSKESSLHGAIYETFSNVNAIVHCHLEWATAYAEKNDSLGFSTYHSEIKLAKNCPVFDTGSYIVSKEQINNILEYLRHHQEVRSFLLRRHGAFTFGNNLRESKILMELIEETAKISILSKLF